MSDGLLDGKDLKAEEWKVPAASLLGQLTNQMAPADWEEIIRTDLMSAFSTTRVDSGRSRRADSRTQPCRENGGRAGEDCRPSASV